MNQHHDHTWKFAVIYGILAFVVLLSSVGAVVAFNTQHNAATKTEVRNALGNRDVVLIAKKNIQDEGAKYGLLVSKQTVISVKQDAKSATVILAVTFVDTATGTASHYRLKVQLTKSLWSVQDVTKA
jgi:hypothetical protein